MDAEPETATLRLKLRQAEDALKQKDAGKQTAIRNNLHKKSCVQICNWQQKSEILY
jgi:hypothetical protein